MEIPSHRLFVTGKAPEHLFGDTHMHKSFHGLYKQLQGKKGIESVSEFANLGKWIDIMLFWINFQGFNLTKLPAFKHDELSELNVEKSAWEKINISSVIIYFYITDRSIWEIDVSKMEKI